ncbi:MAG: L-aspartate oxidase [Acidobacteriota bacterium]
MSRLARLDERAALRKALRCDVVESVDVAVIGAGVGGLAVALATTDRKVALLTKGALAHSGSSPYAQGGIAAAVAAEDSAEAHAEDTRRVGRGLNDAGVVDLLTQGGPAAIERLLEWGTDFDRTADGELDLGREAGHRHRRILHAGGDATGREIVRAMSDAVRRQEHVAVYEHFFAWDLLLDAQGCVVGVLGLRGSERIALLAGETVLASGGLGQVYRYTTNPAAVTGDGLAMAARAGARLVDLEFVQFHPTTLDRGANDSGQVPLLTEALRGDGAWLVDENGRRFMFDVDEAGELAPRDIVARTLFLRASRGEKNFLDLRPVADTAEEFAAHFPTAAASCRAAGLDPMAAPVPVTPAVHYHMGGVWVDGSGRTSVPGLWACGEVTSTGAHGANRLASNSLLEALVFGLRLGAGVAARPRRAHPPRSHAGFPRPRPAALDRADRVETLIGELRDVAWSDIGIVRSRPRLERALVRLDEIERELPAGNPTQRSGELRNMLTTARLVAHCALRREESRGGHYREDFPEARRRWERRQFVDPEPVAVAMGPVSVRQR